MADQVEEVKQKTDIVSVIGEHVDLKKAGSNFKGLCPFHSEKTPSFMVSSELQIYKCFGCGASGDVYTFLQEYEGMEFYEALKTLAEKANVELKSQSFGKRSEKDRYYQVNAWIAHFYHYILLKHPKGRNALNYLLKDRGLKIETIDRFKLGYSPNVPFALKDYIVNKKKVSLSELETLGIIYRRGGNSFDRFRGRVIFPLFDHRENIIGFAGRLMPEDSGKDLAKYINSPETPIYHKSRTLYGLAQVKRDIKRQKEAIITEGELDMLSSWQVGITNTVAIKGSAITEEQLKLLSRFTKKLILALDSDFAGNEAAKKGIFIAQRDDFDIKVANLGKFKDPDDMARQDPEGLKKALKEAVNIWDFLIELSITKHNGESGEGKSKVSKEMVPILSSIEDKIVQSHYVKVLASKLNVPVNAVSEEVSQYKNQGVSQVRSAVQPYEQIEKKDRRDALEERLLSVAFKLDPKLLLNIKEKNLFSSVFTKRVYEEFVKFQEKNKKFDINKLKKSLPEELVEGFVTLILKEIEDVDEEDPVRLKKEFDLLINEIKIFTAKEKLREIEENIRKFESKKDKKGLKKAQQQFAKVSSKLSDLEENS